MNKSFPLLVLLWLATQIVWGSPIIIPATNILGTPNTTVTNISGTAYRFNTGYTSVATAPSNLSVNTILSEPMFNATSVGTFFVNTTHGITYGVGPNYSDNILLSTFLQGDGSTLVYNNNSHNYANNDVFTPNHLPGAGTLLSITGYIYIPQSEVNQPLTYTVTSDDGVYVVINGVAVVNNQGLHPPSTTLSTAEYTKAGLYPVMIAYYDGSPVEAEFKLLFPAGTIFLESLSQFNSLISLNHLTPGQAVVATYINNALVNQKTDSQINCLYNMLLNNPDSLGTYLDEFSPMKFEAFAGEAAFDNDDFVIQEMDNDLASKRGPDGTFAGTGGLDDSGLTFNTSNSDSTLLSIQNRLNSTPSVSTGSRWDTLISGNVILGQTFSDTSIGLAHSDSTSEAALLGEDYRFTPHFLAGPLFGYDHTTADLDDIGSKGRLDAYSPGFYASYVDKGWYSNTLGTFTFDDYSQTRAVNLPCGGYGTSSPSGWQAMLNTDAGYDFHSGALTYGPAFGVHYTHIHVDSYNETGLSSGNLNVSVDEGDSFRSRLGARLRYAFDADGVSFAPHASVEWQHEFFTGLRGISAQFSDLDAGYFTLQSPQVSRDSALADLGVDAKINDTVTCFAAYYVNAGQTNYFAQSVQAGVKITF